MTEPTWDGAEKSLGNLGNSSHWVLEGKLVHIDATGRIYFDSCKTDEEHILVPKPTHGDYRRCRVWMQDLLPKNSKGKKGTFKISIEFVPEEE